jgi:phospholipid transport system substrate-binding protein
VVKQVDKSVRIELRGLAAATLLCTLLFGSTVTSAGAAADDPAVIQVQSLDASLLKSMRAGRSESMADRYQKLKPVIERAFALALMTRLSVGPTWTTFPARQQHALVAAFSRYTIANYAHNFRSFDGQKFAIDGNPVRRGPEKVVRASLIRSNHSPASLLYLMEETNGTWRIVDVYYDGISQLALHRADFASAVGSGEAGVLIDHLNKVSADLMSR